MANHPLNSTSRARRNSRTSVRSICLLAVIALSVTVPLGCKKTDQAVVDVQPAKPGDAPANSTAASSSPVSATPGNSIPGEATSGTSDPSLSPAGTSDPNLPGTTTPSTGPSTLPTEAPPQVLIPAKPVDVFLTIGDRLVKFPPARLLVREDDEGMVAQLTNIDLPDEDLDTANELYLQMRLSEGKLERIGNATWHYRAADETRQEPSRGLFLAGGRRLLQPYDVEIVFDQGDQGVRLRLTGKFLAFDNSADAPEDQVPKVVNVTGSFVVEVDALK